jgi:hypothetical protein
MEIELIKLETGLLAKDKGFDEETTTFFHVGYGKKWVPFVTTGMEYQSDAQCNARWNSMIPYPNDEKSVLCSAPSQSLLQRWLREKHKIDITISTGSKPGKYCTFLKDYIYEKGEILNFDSYEDALEAGLYKALTLIK